MVNGSVAKLTNISVAIIVGICIIGVILLGLNNDDVPAELSMTLTAGIGFLIGTKFTPIDNYTQKKPKDIASNDEVIVQERKP